MTEAAGSQVVAFFDGACPRNQFGRKGAMRAAFVLGDAKVVREVPDLPTDSGPARSNNIAEYQALILLLRHILEREEAQSGARRYLICGDSQLVIYQMRGEYRVRKPHLTPLHAEAARLSASLEVEFQWVPREKNPAGYLLESGGG